MRPCYAEINLGRLEENYNFVKNRNKGKKIISVVKANAYGHGAKEVAEVLYKMGTDYLAVATVEEAIELRKHLPGAQILILGLVADFQLKEALSNNITLTIGSLCQAQKISDISKKLKKKCKVHIAIDTGMRRIGIQCDYGIDKCVEEVRDILKVENIDVEGIFTHFASSDSIDLSYMNHQKELFKEVVEKVDYDFKYIHCSNSAASEFLNEDFYNAVRPGLILYGYSSREENGEREKIKPILSWSCNIVNIKEVKKGLSIGYSQTYYTKKDSIIATLPVGYADGYNRKLSNKGHVYINGEKCNIVGNVCMDQCMIDITNVADCVVGDKVELISDNNSSIDIAKICETIPYEILCGISRRVPRVYVY